MKSTIVKRSIVLAGHKTSVSLEDAFWDGLKDIAKGQRKTLSDLVGGIDTNRKHGNLRRPYGYSYSVIIRRKQRHISRTADRARSSRTRRTEPSTSCNQCHSPRYY